METMVLRFDKKYRLVKICSGVFIPCRYGSSFHTHMRIRTTVRDETNLPLLRDFFFYGLLIFLTRI